MLCNRDAFRIIESIILPSVGRVTGGDNTSGNAAGRDGFGGIIGDVGLGAIDCDAVRKT